MFYCIFGYCSSIISALKFNKYPEIAEVRNILDAEISFESQQLLELIGLKLTKKHQDVGFEDMIAIHYKAKIKVLEACHLMIKISQRRQYLEIFKPFSQQQESIPELSLYSVFCATNQELEFHGVIPFQNTCLGWVHMNMPF